MTRLTVGKEIKIVEKKVVEVKPHGLKKNKK